MKFNLSMKIQFMIKDHIDHSLYYIKMKMLIYNIWKVFYKKITNQKIIKVKKVMKIISLKIMILRKNF